MEIHFSPFNIISLLILFLSSLSVIVRKWKISKTENLPPGPWRLPIIGSLYHLIGKHLHEAARNYGPLMYLGLGETPTLVISSANMAKEILKTHDLAFASRPQLTSTNIVMYENKDITFAPYGDYWRQMRKICTTELLSAKMIKSYSSIRKDEISNLVSAISSTRHSVVNMTSKLHWFTSSILCRSAFGKICKDRDKLISSMQEVLLLVGVFNVCDIFPSWKILHRLSGVTSKLVCAHKKVDAILENLVNEHIENRATGNKGNAEFGGEDLVDVFLRAKENGELQFPITNVDIKGVIFDLFIGGVEAASSTINWALSEMMKNPRVMAKAQSEVRQFEVGDMEKLTYLKLVIKETLRLHPSSPFLGPRECMKQTVIDGYTIPIKTRVLVNVWAIERDSKYWSDPDSFIPERFENSSADFTGNHFEYIPFGAGRRTCPALQLSISIVGHFLAQLLYHFDWAPPHGINKKDLDMTEIFGLTAMKRKELCLIAIKYTNEVDETMKS